LTEFAEQIDHPGLRDFYGYWLSKRGGKRVPARADIDPVEIHRFLPNIFMIDVIEGGARFRYRLVGTAIGDAVGDYSGRYVDEALPPAQYETYRQRYLRILNELAVLYEVARIVWRERPAVLFRRLLLPLSNDQVRANILLGVGYYDYGIRPPHQRHRIDEVVRIDLVSQVFGQPPPGA
jgi:hypothetical protein